MVNDEKQDIQLMNDEEMEQVSGGLPKEFEDILIIGNKKLDRTVEEGKLYQGSKDSHNYAIVHNRYNQKNQKLNV